MKQTDNAIFSPVKTRGKIAGNITWVNITPGGVSIDCAARISTGSTNFTPAIVYVTMTQNAPSPINITFENSPIPNQAIKSGSRLIAEMERPNVMMGCENFSKKIERAECRERGGQYDEKTGGAE